MPPIALRQSFLLQNPPCCCFNAALISLSSSAAKSKITKPALTCVSQLLCCSSFCRRLCNAADFLPLSASSNSRAGSAGSHAVAIYVASHLPYAVFGRTTLCSLQQKNKLFFLLYVYALAQKTCSVSQPACRQK